MNNPNIPAALADGILQNWVRKGVKIVSDLYTNNVFLSFSQLLEIYDLDKSNFFQIFTN